MLCQGFVLLTIVLFIIDKSAHSQALTLEKEASTQVAYFIFFQGISLLLMNAEKIINKTINIQNSQKKIRFLILSILLFMMIVIPITITLGKLKVLHYFTSIFHFTQGFQLLSVQSGVLVFILFNLILLIINPFQTAEKLHTRFVNTFTIGKLALLVMVILVPVLLIWGGDLSSVNIDLSVVILLFINLTLFLTELFLYFQIKEIQKNPEVRF